MKPHLVIFARAPRRGAVKRRLAADIGAGAALAFYRQTLFDVTRRLGGDRRWRTWLAATPDTSAARPGLWPPVPGVRLIRQGGGDLGERMARPLRTLPPGPAIIVGTDIPDIAPDHIAAGFAALQHRVWLMTELANPLMLAAMVLIAASFTMRHTRFGKTGIMVLFALLLGFGIFFLRNFAQVLGESGQLPVAVAAWTPPLAAILLSLGFLFHTEDG